MKPEISQEQLEADARARAREDRSWADKARKNGSPTADDLDAEADASEKAADAVEERGRSITAGALRDVIPETDAPKKPQLRLFGVQGDGENRGGNARFIDRL